MELEQYRNLNEYTLRKMLRESRNFPERRRLRAILKEISIRPQISRPGETVSKSNGVSVTAETARVPNNDLEEGAPIKCRLAVTGDFRKTNGICADDSFIGVTFAPAASRRPTLVRCRSYTSTLHIDLSHAGHINNNNFNASYISITPVNDTGRMAAAAGQPRPMASSVELPPGLDTRRPSGVIGAYRVIRRSSQMLSDSGPLLSRPAGQSPTNATPASPLLQIASDINDSFISARRTSNSRRFSSDTFTTSSDSRNVNSRTTSHHPDVSSNRSSPLSSPSLSNDKLSSNHSLTSSISSSSPSSSHSRNDNANTDPTETPLPKDVGTLRNSPRSFSIFQSHKSESVHSMTQSPDRRESSSSVDPHISSDSLERRRKSKMFSELREAGRQLLSETSGHHHNINTASSSQQYSQTGSDETENGAGVDQLAPDPASNEQRTKSKFLSSLYSGQEKIKNFINRGRNQLKAHELSLKLNHRVGQQTGHLENLAKEGSRRNPNDYEDQLNIGNGDDASEEVIDRSSAGREIEGVSHAPPPATASGGLNCSADDTAATCETSWIGGRRRNSASGSPGEGGERLSIGKSLPTDDVTAESEQLANKDKTVVELTNVGVSAGWHGVNHHNDIWDDSPGLERCSPADDSVFSPAPLTVSSDSIHGPVKSATAPRSHSYFEFFDLSKIKRPNSLSPASSASSSRCGTPTLSGLEQGRTSDRRRFSLPDVMEAKSKVQGALKTAADIHHKYTSGRFSPTGRSARHRSGSQHIMSEKPPGSSGSGAPLPSKSPRHVPPLCLTGVSTLKAPPDSKRLKSVAHDKSKHSVSRIHKDAAEHTRKDFSRPLVSAGRAVDSGVVSGDRLSALPRRSHSDAVTFKESRRTSFPVSSTPSTNGSGSKGRQTSAGHHDPSVKVSLVDRSEEKMKPGHNDKRGVDKGHPKLTSGHLVRRSSEYAPVISRHVGSEVSTTLSSANYKGVTSLSELQKLLTQTEDSIERNKIRNVIRQLRQLPEVEQLKKGKTTGVRTTASLRLTSQPTHTSDSKRSSLSFTSPSSGQITSSTTKTVHDNGPVQGPAHTPLSLIPTLTSQLTADGPSSSPLTPRQTIFQKDKDKSTARVASSSATSTDHHSKDSDDATTSTFNHGVIDSPVAPKKNTSNPDSSLAESSNVLAQVKARLQSRRHSSNVDIKTPDHLRSPQVGHSLTPSSDDVFLYPDPGAPPGALPDRNYRRGSAGYRETRQQILKSSGLAYEPRLSLTRDQLSSTVSVDSPSLHDVNELKSDVKIVDTARTAEMSEPVSTQSTEEATVDQCRQAVAQGDMRVETSLNSSVIEAPYSGKESPAGDLHSAVSLREDEIAMNIAKSRVVDTLQPGHVSRGVKDAGHHDAPVVSLSKLGSDQEKTDIAWSQSQNSQQSDLLGTTMNERTTDNITMNERTTDNIASVSETKEYIRKQDILDVQPVNSGMALVTDMTLATDHAVIHESIKDHSSLTSDQPSAVSNSPETVELPSKPTLTRSRPVGRSLTESRLSRPERFREVPQLARIEENVEMHRYDPSRQQQQAQQHETQQQQQQQQQQRGGRQRKVGVFMTGGAPFAGPTSLTTESEQTTEMHHDYGLRLAPEASHLNNLLRDFQIQKPVDEESLMARMKRFSAPVSNSVHIQMAAQVEDTGQSKRRHSEIYNKQEAIKIEQAFTSLLEDLEIVSGSEGTISDHDLSENDDSLSSSHGSSGSRSSALGEVDSGVRVDGLASTPQHHTDRSGDTTHHIDIKTEDDDLNTDLQNAQSDMDSQMMESLSLDLTSLSKEDSGIVMSPDEHVIGQEAINVDRSKPLAVLPSTSESNTTLSTANLVYTDSTDGGPVEIMTGERLHPAEPHTDMDAVDLIDSESTTTPAVLHATAPTASVVAAASVPHQAQQQEVAVGTRTFHVNRDHDGGVTLQASAEDENQNRVVTVRTLKQRTPSDADEELRDKIVQKKVVSPGGTVLEEKAVVQTKTKLTSRGSNYYTRSTYTTRTKRDGLGQETVEHNVSVETENKSVSQGQSWGNKVVTSVTLGDNGAPVLPEENGSGGTPITELIISNKNSLALREKEVPKIAPSLSTVSAKEIMDAISSVKIEGPPEITQPLSDVTALEGKHVVLTCVIKSSQTTHVTWYKDDVEITQADLYACHYDDREGRATLRIPDATIFDTATYCVVCQNSVGEARTKCSVVIKRKFEKVPTITGKLSDITVKEGLSVHFVCSVTGAARISWYKDGTVLPASPDVQQVYDGQEAQLVLSDVLLSDAGCYECVASNDCGDASTSCKLTVSEDISEDTVVPMFLTRFSDVKAFGGDTLSLECEVIGSPEPNITWLKNFRDLPTDLSFSTSYDGRLCILQINNIKAEDSGIYKCIAENAAGKNSVDARVDVIVRKAPHFVSQLEDVSVSPGKGVVLRCSISGTPQPTVSWKKNGSNIGQSPNCIDSYHNGVARLEILRIGTQDTGVYECVAENVVTQTTTSCKVTLSEPEVQKSKEELVVEAIPKVTRARTFKKLSEPQPADIIKAVLQRASSVTLQRTQSFGANSSSQEELNKTVLHQQQDDRHSLMQDIPRPAPAGEGTSTAFPSRPDSLGLMHKPGVSSRSLTSLDISPKTDHCSPLPQSTKVTNLGRSVSMHVVRNNTLLSPDSSLSTNKVTWAPTKSRESVEPRETISKASSLEVITESRPLNFIPGYRSVSPVFLTSPDKEKLTSSPLAVSNITNITHRPDAMNHIIPKSETVHRVPEKTLTPSSLPSTSDLHPLNEISTSKPSISSVSPSPSTSGKDESPRLSSDAKVTLPRVSQLRLQFLQNDKLAEQQSRPPVNTGAGIKRWHSLPPQDTRPTVVKRDRPPVLPTPTLVNMPSYDEINDEDELHKLMNSTEDFEERKKIRARLREIRDKQREEFEAKRKQREAEAEDLVKKKFEKAEEEKKKKLEAYKQQAPTHERDSKYHEVTQNLIADKYKAAEEEKAKKLAAYTHIAETTGPGGDKSVIKTSVTEKTPGGGIRTTTTTTTKVETKGFGGVAYGKPAEVTAQDLAQRLMNASGPGVSGRITVRTESWNSSDGRVEKSEKSQSWGAKPQGAQSAMAAFKQMDNANAPADKPKPNLARSPSAIKQVLLDWTKAMTRGYPGVEITNFSSSWNNGLAFCALIHHFFPNAFDFNSLEPTKRRYNFTLAFDTAEKEANIAPLLDVEDMVKMKNPDWKCVFTYVQSIYRHLKDHENNKANPIEQ